MPVVHPVIVGIGQITYHPEEHSDFLHPLQLGKIAVEDCRCAAVLGHANTVTVINMFSHGYADPAGLFCEMLGIQPRVREYTAIGGNTPQWLVNRMADRIARGEISVAVLVGAEAMHNAPAETRDNWLQDLAASGGLARWWAIRGGAPRRTRCCTTPVIPSRSTPSTRMHCGLPGG
jgi:acetyl-CoA acetyltransferase